MGRKRLYSSEEDKAAANREKSRKHYEKNQPKISAKRRQKYCEDIRDSCQQQKQTLKVHKVNNLRRALRNHFSAFHDLLGNSAPKPFLEHLYQQYVAALRAGPASAGSDNDADDPDPVQVSVSAFTEVHRLVMALQSDILTAAGATGAAMKEYKAVSSSIRRMVDCLEDIQINGMEGLDTLERAHQNGALLYQD